MESRGGESSHFSFEKRTMDFGQPDKGGFAARHSHPVRANCTTGREAQLIRLSTVTTLVLLQISLNSPSFSLQLAQHCDQAGLIDLRVKNRHETRRCGKKRRNGALFEFLSAAARTPPRPRHNLLPAPRAVPPLPLLAKRNHRSVLLALVSIVPALHPHRREPQSGRGQAPGERKENEDGQ